MLVAHEQQVIWTIYKREGGRERWEGGQGNGGRGRGRESEAQGERDGVSQKPHQTLRWEIAW